MKILYILKQDLDGTGKKIIEEHRKGNEVTVVDLRENKNYGEIVGMIESNDKVICW